MHQLSQGFWQPPLPCASLWQPWALLSHATSGAEPSFLWPEKWLSHRPVSQLLPTVEVPQLLFKDRSTFYFQNLQRKINSVTLGQQKHNFGHKYFGILYTQLRVDIIFHHFDLQFSFWRYQIFTLYTIITNWDSGLQIYFYHCSFVGMESWYVYTPDWVSLCCYKRSYIYLLSSCFCLNHSLAKRGEGGGVSLKEQSMLDCAQTYNLLTSPSPVPGLNMGYHI